MPSAWSGCWRSLAASVAGSPTAPQLLVGTGTDQVHLLMPSPRDRGLAGAFNANVGRADPQPRAPAGGRGQDGQDLRRRPQGPRLPAPRVRPAGSSATSSYVGRKAIDFADAEAIAARVVAMLDAGEFDVCTVIYNRFQSVISQVPTEMQLIPAPLPDGGGDTPDRAQAIYEFEPDEEDHPGPAAAAEPRDPDLPRAAGKRRRRSTARR